METKYFVVEAYRYKESANWERKLTGMYDTLEEAKQVYHARLGAIIKTSNDFAMCILFDNWGTVVKTDYANTYVEPEPEAAQD